MPFRNSKGQRTRAGTWLDQRTRSSTGPSPNGLFSLSFVFVSASFLPLVPWSARDLLRRKKTADHRITCSKVSLEIEPLVLQVNVGFVCVLFFIRVNGICLYLNRVAACVFYVYRW